MPEEGKRGFLRPRPLELYHERTRTRGVNRWVYWPARWALKAFILVYFRLRRLGQRAHPQGGRDPRRQPPLLPRSVRDRLLHRPADLLRGQAGALQEPADRLVPQLHGRLPCPARRVRRGLGGHLAGAARPRPGRGHLPRGHPHPRGLAGRAQARRRPPGAPERRPRGADRHHRQRARPQRLPHPAGQGPHPLRRPAHLPARGRSLPVPRRRGDRAHLALRGPAVGVARRPAAAADRRRGGRGLHGHGDGTRARARGPRGSARLPHRRPGRAPGRGQRERDVPARRDARQGGRAQARDRDRVRRRGPRGARRPLQLACPPRWARSVRG